MGKEQFFKEGDLVGDYSVIRLLGKGTSGEVYLVKHQLLDQLKAMKVIVSDELFSDTVQHERFLREIRIAASIQHPNLISVSYVSQYQELGLSYIIMDYADGCSLQDHLNSNNFHVSTDFALNVVEKVASALDAISRHGVVHRDIKPANIMLTKDGQIKLADLGIAKVAQDSEFASHGEVEKTMQNTIVGTPVYASPEQNQDASAADVRSDIYSLGMCLYLMAAGKLPFQSASLMGVIGEILYGQIPEPSELSPTVPKLLSQFVMRMIARNPADRPQTPQQLLEELADLRKGLAGGSPAESKKPSVKPTLSPGLRAPTLKKIQVPPVRGTALKIPTLQRPAPAIPATPLTEPQDPDSSGEETLPLHSVVTQGNEPLPEPRTGLRPETYPPPRTELRPETYEENPVQNAEREEVIISELELNADIPFTWDQIPLFCIAFSQRLYGFLLKNFTELWTTLLLCGLIVGAIFFNNFYLFEFAKKGSSEEQDHASLRNIRELKLAKTPQKRRIIQTILARDGHWDSLCALIGSHQISQCIQELQKQDDPDCLLTAATLLMINADGKDHKEEAILKLLERGTEKGSREAAFFLWQWYEISGNKNKAAEFRDLVRKLEQEEKELASQENGESTAAETAKSSTPRDGKPADWKFIEPFALYADKNGWESISLEEYNAAWNRGREDLVLGQKLKKKRNIQITLFLQFIRREAVYRSSPYRTYILRRKVLYSSLPPFDRENASAQLRKEAYLVCRLFEEGDMIKFAVEQDGFSRKYFGVYHGLRTEGSQTYIKIGSAECELSMIPENIRWRFDRKLLEKRRTEFIQNGLTHRENLHCMHNMGKVDSMLSQDFGNLRDDPFIAKMNPFFHRGEQQNNR